MHALECPHCHAPLDPSGSMVVCAYCRRTIAGVPTLPWRPGPVDWAGRPEDVGRPRIDVGGLRFVVDGRLARGDSCEVFLGHKDAALTERVVIKVLRAKEDADLLARERRILRRLARSEAPGAPWFRRLIPSPVRHGVARIEGVAGPEAAVYRWHHGFTVSGEDVRAAFPTGVDPRAAVWMWKRGLELLAWVHASGVVHGAVLPAHLVFHPRDHGVVLVGWSVARWRHGPDEPLAAFRRADLALYPGDVREGAPSTPATDLAMSARTIAALLGGAPARLPRRVPAPLAALIASAAIPGRADAWALRDELDAAAREAFGPPRYVRFEMPAPKGRRGR